MILILALSLGAGYAAAAETEAAAPEAETGDAAPEAFEARITELDGEVYLYQKDEEEGLPAEAGMPLEPGDRIETRAQARVELALEADSVLELGADTVFTIDALEKEESVFALSLGSLVAKFRYFVRKSRRHRILTPTAVAAVRGTEFGVEVGAEGDTAVGVFDEGEVAVTSTDDSVDETVLKAREETTVGRQNLDTEERDGRRRLRRRKLTSLKARLKRIERLRGRRAQLRKKWLRLPPGQRLKVRSKMIELHRERLKKMPKKRRLALLRRMKRSALKHKIDRKKHRLVGEKLRQRVRQNRGPRRGGKGLRGRRGQQPRQDAAPGQRQKAKRNIRQKIRRKVKENRKKRGEKGRR